MVMTTGKARHRRLWRGFIGLLAVGAAAFAGLDHVARARRPVAIISGGNIDPARLAALC